MLCCAASCCLEVSHNPGAADLHPDCVWQGTSPHMNRMDYLQVCHHQLLLRTAAAVILSLNNMGMRKLARRPPLAMQTHLVWVCCQVACTMCCYLQGMDQCQQLDVNSGQCCHVTGGTCKAGHCGYRGSEHNDQRLFLLCIRCICNILWRALALQTPALTHHYLEMCTHQAGSRQQPCASSSSPAKSSSFCYRLGSISCPTCPPVCIDSSEGSDTSS
jgi:hypothetical protein